MAAKIFFVCGALLQLQHVLASPVARFPVFEKRSNITVDPPNPKEITPIITEIVSMPEEELENLWKRGSKTLPLAPRETGTDGALLTYIGGATQDGCTDFVINGPFTTIHPTFGTSNIRGISATSYGGNTTEIIANDAVVDPGEFKFADNERISKFTVVVDGTDPQVAGFTFETDAGNKYEALSETITSPVYTDLSVGSGILARIRGSDCKSVNGIFGTFGVDFLDELDSISISNIDYEGFTQNIMPTGAGTQLSVGSQVLDNRNSSEKQTITLTTTDAITAQRTITTQTRAQVGGSVTIKASVGVPLVSEGETTAEANWQIEAMAVSLCPKLIFSLHNRSLTL